jgi:hypothetical protein
MSTTERSEIGTPGTANLPWSELGFEFRPTKSHLRMVYKDGKWGEEELVEVSGCVDVTLTVIIKMSEQWFYLTRSRIFSCANANFLS